MDFPSDVTDRGFCRQIERHLAVIPVVAVVTLSIEHRGTSSRWSVLEQDFEMVDVHSKHVIPADSHMTSCFLVYMLFLMLLYLARSLALLSNLGNLARIVVQRVHHILLEQVNCAASVTMVTLKTELTH